MTIQRLSRLLLSFVMIGVLSACSANPLSMVGSMAAQPALTPQPVAAGDYAPTLTLDPPAGHGGLYVRVSGSNWPPNMMVIVRLEDDQGASDTLAAANTGFDGNLSTGFLYPIDERWLAATSYQVTATTADGKYAHTATFGVGQPGAVAMATQVPEPEATAAAAPAAPTPRPSPTPEPQPTTEPEPTPAPAAATSDDKGAAANSVTVDRAIEPALAGFVPVDVKRDKVVYRIQVGTPAQLAGAAQIHAVIQTPPVDNYRDRQLKEHKKKREVTFTNNKVEIKAPNPAAFLEVLRTNGGFPVVDGQLIEVKLRPSAVVKVEAENGVLKFEAPSISMLVTITYPDGQVRKTTAQLGPEHQLADASPNLERGRLNRAPGPPPWARGNGDDDDDDD